MKTLYPRTIATFALASLLSAHFSLAHAAQPGDGLFADGKIWTMSGSDGHSGKVIFNADGTGKISSGIMSMGLSWIQKAGVTCMKMGPMGEECFSLSPVPGGYDGVEQGGKRKMTLRRN